MKRILSLAVAASMLLSAIPAMAETATEATYIPAPYNAEEVDPTKTYLEPVFYQNENGPTIGVTTVGVIQQDGLYFKDSDTTSWTRSKTGVCRRKNAPRTWSRR